MIQTIYVLAMACYPMVFDERDTFDRHVESATGPGCRVLACHFHNDAVVRQILLNLDKRNRTTAILQDDTSMDLELMELVVESLEPLTYKDLPWLNDHFKIYFSSDDHLNSAGYFFYLVEDGGRLRIKVTAKLLTMQSDLDETTCGDDFSYMDEMAVFLDRYLYHRDAENLFPDQMAKLFLQFGE